MRKFDTQHLPGSSWPTHLCLPDCDVDIEIGSGVGLHPIKYARLNPHRCVISIEHTKERFRKYRERLRSEPIIPNLFAVHANAISWIGHLVPESSISRIILLYPNPWPKKKQKNKRWHAMPFMAKLIEVLVPGGTIQIVTNEIFYYEEAKAYLTNEWNLQQIQDCRYDLTALPPHFPRTHFEKKYIENGQSCWDIIYKTPDL